MNLASRSFNFTFENGKGVHPIIEASNRVFKEHTDNLNETAILINTVISVGRVLAILRQHKQYPIQEKVIINLQINENGTVPFSADASLGGYYIILCCFVLYLERVSNLLTDLVIPY